MLLEMDPLLRRMEAVRRETRAGLDLALGQLSGRPAALLCSGIGKVNAARGAQFLFDLFQPSRLLVCGVAGSLSPELKVGDVVVASEVLFHDVGMVVAGGEFVATGASLPDHRGEAACWRRLEADPRLVSLATDAAQAMEGRREGSSFRAMTGPLVTGDQAVFCSLKKASLREATGALAVDMESAAVGQVAKACGIPFGAIRAISDLADEGIGLDPSALIHYADQGSPGPSWARSAGHLASDPRRLAGALRLRRDMKRAAEVAVLVTMDTLAGLAP